MGTVVCSGRLGAAHNRADVMIKSFGQPTLSISTQVLRKMEQRYKELHPNEAPSTDGAYFLQRAGEAVPRILYEETFNLKKNGHKLDCTE